jgi:DNA polymerase-3 subunit delta'
MNATKSLSTKICPWLLEPLEQLEQARLAGHLAHGWLLSGPKGVGKINLALVAAHRLLDAQTEPPQELGPEEGGRAMEERHEQADHHPDLHWLFPGGNENEADPPARKRKRRTLGVDQIRDHLIEPLALTSLKGVAKVAILENADAMTASAAGALLKTLEEPTAQTYLLLVSHQPGKLPATIRSRCQNLPVPKPPMPEALSWLSRHDAATNESDWRQLLVLAEGSPFRAMTFHSNEYISKNKLLDDQFNLISKGEVDPQTVADQWVKDDLELALNWLSARLRESIQARMAPAESPNSATDQDSDRLHNSWQGLPSRALFHRLQSTEVLLRQLELGKGINADLATRALLLGLQREMRICKS